MVHYTCATWVSGTYICVNPPSNFLSKFTTRTFYFHKGETEQIVQPSLPVQKATKRRTEPLIGHNPESNWSPSAHARYTNSRRMQSGRDNELHHVSIRFRFAKYFWLVHIIRLHVSPNNTDRTKKKQIRGPVGIL